MMFCKSGSKYNLVFAPDFALFCKVGWIYQYFKGHAAVVKENLKISPTQLIFIWQLLPKDLKWNIACNWILTPLLYSYSCVPLYANFKLQNVEDKHIRLWIIHCDIFQFQHIIECVLYSHMCRLYTLYTPVNVYILSQCVRDCHVGRSYCDSQKISEIIETDQNILLMTSYEWLQCNYRRVTSINHQ